MQNQKHPNPGDFIRAAREAKGLSQAQLAGRVGTKQQTIEKIELGKTKHSKFFPRIAKELNIDPRKLMPDLGSSSGGQVFIPESELRSGERDFPVHAAAQGGRGELIVSTDPVSWVMCPAPLVGISRAYGIIVVGDSMIPELWPGDTALIHPHMPPERNETYVFYSENNDGDVHATIKHLLRWTESTWFLKQWNPGRGQRADFTLPRKEWGKCHRVIGKYSK